MVSLHRPVKITEFTKPQLLLRQLGEALRHLDTDEDGEEHVIDVSSRRPMSIKFFFKLILFKMHS